ncbi:hypothetical protein AJ80_06100 [Polytolypa hystricis UAMH7299]|uniref:PEP phosphonomutase n=1 Tax=Polytolypa hystricis (strain UAMH7299) TaxID=1447883 RepID=A0A2B7XYS3_POLH7|nr:hypothetical protein AJ80_06100 [Polytolypa hystricis UAMH7299]
MSDSADSRAQLLRSLHIPSSPIVFSNVWDATTAQYVASHPTSTALATASFAIASVHGVADDALDLPTNLSAISRIIPIALKHNKPITIDMQDGYGDRLEEGIEAIISLGASGCNLEDRDNATGELFPLDIAVQRVQRVVATATRLGVPNFVLNARTDTIVVGNEVDDAIVRGKAYLEAGAANVFVWGGPKRGGLKKEEAKRVCEALGGKVNVIAVPGESGGLSVRELADLGVARISVGPRLWRKANAAFEMAADELLGEYKALRE